MTWWITVHPVGFYFHPRPENGKKTGKKGGSVIGERGEGRRKVRKGVG